MFSAKLKQECQENFDGELEAKYVKIIGCHVIRSKPIKYNKNADTPLFLLIFTTGELEKNLEKTLFVSAGAQKRVKNSMFQECFTTISTKY